MVCFPPIPAMTAFDLMLTFAEEPATSIEEGQQAPDSPVYQTIDPQSGDTQIGEC